MNQQHAAMVQRVFGPTATVGGSLGARCWISIDGKRFGHGRSVQEAIDKTQRLLACLQRFKCLRFASDVAPRNAGRTITC